MLNDSNRLYKVTSLVDMSVPGTKQTMHNIAYMYLVGVAVVPRYRATQESCKNVVRK